MERRDFVRTGVVAGVAVLGGGACSAAERMASPGGSAAPRPAAATMSPGLATEARVRAARPLPLTAVRLTGGPLKHAQELDSAYLMKLDPDRMLAYYRIRAGLAKKAEPYGGWDGGGRNLTGHIAGHHLSAVSLMYAATGDARMKQRADYIVSELKSVQDANGDGYLGALENGREAFGALSRGEIRSSSFDLNGLWSPWYTLHKTFAGLRDAYRYTGNRTALDVETRFAEWAAGILAPLDDAQIQHMLHTEFGGMNEVMADLYADTGDERWLKLSYDFEDRSITGPLQRHRDPLGGKHGNTNIPKAIGSADRYAYTGRTADAIAATYFMDLVAEHHSFSTGGDGKDEYFGPADEIGAIIDGRTAESCNVYNMLKLARRVFEFSPEPHYADFHERALYNHVLGSIAPDNGDMCYMVPVGKGVTHEYQDMFRSFTCCVGTGMENHALHGHGLYYEHGDRLWVNVYAPSTATWEAKGVQLAMETGFPEGDDATLRLRLQQPSPFTLSLRRPYWTGGAFQVRVNGQPVSLPERWTAPTGPGPDARQDADAQREPIVIPGPSDYVDITREWKSGDVVEIALPKPLRLEPTPDDPRRAAIMWGPLVLAGDLGPEPPRRREQDDTGDEDLTGHSPAPVLVAAERPVAEWVERVPGTPVRFRTAGVGHEADAAGKPLDVELVPFYRLHHRTYAGYWDLYTPDEWERQRKAYADEAARLKKLEAMTVAYVEPGRRQSEQRFHYQGAKDAQFRRLIGRSARSARTWFSYEVPVEPAGPMTLLVTYYSDDRRSEPASFRILVDGKPLAAQKVERELPARFYDVAYHIPASMIHGKTAVTVRFQADEDSQVAAVFGIRIVRGDGKI